MTFTKNQKKIHDIVLFHDPEFLSEIKNEEILLDLENLIIICKKQNEKIEVDDIKKYLESKYKNNHLEIKKRIIDRLCFIKSDS